MTKNKERVYKMHFSTPREITKWKNLHITMYLRLTPEEYDIVSKQQLQVNEQRFTSADNSVMKTISHTFLMGNYMKPSRKEIYGKIFIDHKDKWDKEVLQKYVEQLLEWVKNNILTKRQNESKDKG